MNIPFLKKQLLVLALVIPFISFSQPGGDWTDKISWSFSLKKKDESHATIIATAKLKTGWHVFSVSHDPDKADMTGYPTKFTFTPNKNYKLVGKFRDGTKAKVHTDDLGTSLYFEGTGTFHQDIEVLSDKAFDINFEYAFQICDENGCIFPPDQEGKIKVSGFKPEVDLTDIIDVKNLSIDGNFGKDNQNRYYVFFNNNWIIVPEGNSKEFYLKYLQITNK